MNYIQFLASFFTKASTDERLNPTHVSMFVSLLQFWYINHFVNPVSITRHDLMKVSKINSKATYHKCMRELNEYGYLKYSPSYNSYKGSMVYLYNFQSGTVLIYEHVDNSQSKIQSCTEPNFEQVDDSQSKFQTCTIPNNEQVCKSPTKIQTCTVPNNEQVENNLTKIKSGTVLKNEHLIHNTLIHNTLIHNTNTQALKKDVHFLVRSSEIQTNTEEKSCAKKEIIKKKEDENTPTLLQVNEYFKEQNYPEIESNKFFNYYTSVGWLVGGRSKMKNWKAASNNWILNIKNLEVLQPNKLKANHLHSPKNKKYNEPL